MVSAGVLFALGCGNEPGGRASSSIGGGIVSAGEDGGGTAGQGDDEGAHDSSGGQGSSGAADGDGAPKFDIASTPDGGGVDASCPLGGHVLGDGGGEMGGAGQFSYIWIANSAEGTVSKVDTVSGIEEARYATGPSHPGGSPSRTSVNQFGDAVVVNRGPGGIAKVAARLSDCEDQNGDGVITTSAGPGDVKPFGEDECLLWYVPIPSPDSEAGPRPVAWEGVEVGEDGCALTAPRVWVSWRDAASVAHVVRLDGRDGTQLDEVLIPWAGGNGRPYGGAVNAAGDFWITAKKSGQRTIRIDAETLEVTEHWTTTAGSIYGMAVDDAGDVWGGRDSGGIAHYHTSLATWTEITIPEHGRFRGIMVDREGRAWAAANEPCGVVGIDTATDAVIADIALPGCGTPVGISIDAEGYVWVVDMDANLAFKVDPDTHAVALTVGGLNVPYTYSDMTGAGLDLVLNPPG